MRVNFAEQIFYEKFQIGFVLRIGVPSEDTVIYSIQD